MKMTELLREKAFDRITIGSRVCDADDRNFASACARCEFDGCFLPHHFSGTPMDQEGVMFGFI